MYILEVNQERCDGCLKCDDHLPGLCAMAQNGSVLLSPANLDKKGGIILRGMAACKGQAVTVRELEEV